MVHFRPFSGLVIASISMIAATPTARWLSLEERQGELAEHEVQRRSDENSKVLICDGSA
jgi:hypothetical protein